MGAWAKIIDVFLDGENIPAGLSEIISSWQTVWDSVYEGDEGGIEFAAPINLKNAANRTALPLALAEIEQVRNPDMYFVERISNRPLGGVEVTTHSPDGSNIEKRYPFLWVSRRFGLDAFVATPYQKWRPAGNSNRLPYRHAERNLSYLNVWNVKDLGQSAPILLPIQELHGYELNRVDATVAHLMPNWQTLGSFFAHRHAQRNGSERSRLHAEGALEELRLRLITFFKACLLNTKHEPAATLHKSATRWIQVYNSRPDTGHWERGEGQFDSIDGRIMFTLDEILLLTNSDRPAALELWLPQMSSQHAWILEQVDREYQSKRFRNLCKYLPNACSHVSFSVRYADELSDEDWKLLQNNPSLCVERQDRRPGIYSLAEMLKSSKLVEHPNTVSFLIAGINDMFLSTHRAYKAGWFDDLQEKIKTLPRNATLLCPRLPGASMRKLRHSPSISILAAENCTKSHLLLLRYLRG